MEKKRLKIVYLTPALYMAGGVERVLSLKASYMAENYDYDITIILTEGKDKPLFYPLSDKIRVINLNIGFEELWTCSFLKKIVVYLKKQRIYKRLLTQELMRLRPDITVSLLRREINFLTSIKDGSRKVGELHVNKTNYRNFEANDTNFLKKVFERYWLGNLIGNLRKLDKFVVLTHEDRSSWKELERINVIPNPMSFIPQEISPLARKRVIAVGRYVYQKGFDLLLRAWAIVERQCPDWELAVYGTGDRSLYECLAAELFLKHCSLNDSTKDIEKEYLDSSLFVLSSRFEGFGMVLVEAMACGLPVVSFACPCGPRDIISDGQDGLLAENGNVTQLAEKMLVLIQSPEYLSQMAEAAQKKSERYRIEYIAKQWKKLFEGLWHTK